MNTKQLQFAGYPLLEYSHFKLRDIATIDLVFRELLGLGRVTVEMDVPVDCKKVLVEEQHSPEVRTQTFNIYY